MKCLNWCFFYFQIVKLEGRNTKIISNPKPSLPARSKALTCAPIATAVGGGQRARALLQIPRHLAILRRAAHAQRVDAVGVAVAGARVVVAAAVARGPHEHGAATLAPFERALAERLCNN